MPTHAKQQAVCVRPGCHKVPTRSIPTSLFTGRRAKVCKACYTWMRRHFQVEPNGKHVRCADLGVLDRCRDMLVDFAKAGVFPVESARRAPNLLLSPSSKYYCAESMPSGSLAFADDHPTCPTASKPPVSSSAASRRSRRGRGSRRTTSAPRAIKRGTARTRRAAAAHAMPTAGLDADLSASSPPEAKLPAPVARLDDGLMRVGDSTPTMYQYSGSSSSFASGLSTPKHKCGWQDVGFDELSDTDMPQPPAVRRVSSVASTSSTMSDSDMASHAHPPAHPPATRGTWEGEADEEDSQGVDFDELSTLSMHAWQALVDEGTPRSFSIDFDMDGEVAWADDDVNMAAATPGAAAGLTTSGMPSGLPAGLSAGLPSGPPSLHGVVTHFAPRSNSPSALLFPAGMPPSMTPAAPPTQQHSVGSARIVPTLRCPPPRAMSMMAHRRSSGGTPPVHMRGRRAFHVTGGASPDIKPELQLSRTYAQDVSVAACGATCPRPVERAVTPQFCPPLARVASNDSLFSCTVDGLEPVDAVLPVVPDRRYGRRQASAGVGRAVAAITAASPTVC